MPKSLKVLSLKRLLPVWFAAVAVLPLSARNITFRHLTPDNGLSQVSVNALYIDARGFVWIGTREGLNLYNGNDIRTFRLDKDDPKSLFCNNVLRITGDNEGNIYLLCTDGVARLDLHRDEFTTLYEGSVSAICYDSVLYVAWGGRIDSYDPAAGTFEPWYTLPGGAQGKITALYRDPEGVMWIGTERQGIFSLDRDGRPDHPVREGNVIGFYRDSKENVWVGTWEHGLWRRDAEGRWSNLRSGRGEGKGLLSDFVRSVCEDNQGNIWIGTFLGLNRLDVRTGKMDAFVADGRPGSLSHSSVWCLLKDPQGTIWAGTYFGGVNYFNPEYEIYTRYGVSETPGEGLSSPIVGKMIEDDRGRLWICTEGGGVNVLDRETGRFTWYRHGPGGISHNNVKAILYDRERGAMWFGTHLGGLNRLDPATGRFTVYRHREGDPATLPSDIVRDIVPWGRSLVVATADGVCLFDPATGRADRLFGDTEEGRTIGTVADLHIDDRGTLWIAATGEGLFSYRFDTRELKAYRHDPDDPNSLSSNNINSIVQDRKGNLWLATSGTGLDRYRYGSDDFENYDARHNGLSSDCVYDVRDSPTGRLLVATNEGLSRFDPVTGRFENYNHRNGFPLSAVNENAICLTRDGQIFLGGTQGMVSFNETSLSFTPKPYRIVPSRLTVNGRPVKAGDGTGILDYSLCYSQGITLRSRHTIFSVEFATSNFVPANRDEIVYKLEGFSEDWNPARGQHTITYSNLNPGDYTLIIRSAKDSGANTPEARLAIRVLPPFYRTVWACLFYLAAAGALLWFLIRTYKGRIRLQESLRYEQQHIRDVEELNQSKLRFFTNISHEFRTPLTLIIGQVEMLLQVQSFTPTIYNKILRIYKNSLQLKELVGELLDFRKQDQGHMKIRVGEHDLVAFLYENFLIFMEYAGYRHLNLLFDRGVDKLAVWYDPVQMQKVVNNLISNAMKHTPRDGTITVHVWRGDDRAFFSVSDTGRGIAPEDADHIFDRFYQMRHPDSVAAQGTGIGLALSKGIVELHGGTIGVDSEPGRGSTFTVSLPLGNAHFSGEQIVRETAECPEAEDAAPEKAFLREKEEMDEGVYDRIRGARILIVEDNEQLREMLVRLFEPFYEVDTASDGEQGWALVLSREPQIVLSDVVMPRLSGTELCKRIKTDVNTCHIPVVLLTARTAVEHNIEGLRIGADDYITKPFNVGLLLSRCNNLVNNRMVLREKFSRQPDRSPRMLATNPVDKQLMDRAMSIIERYMDDPEFNVGTFAREMGMARTNLFAKIKGITGSTPNEFVSTIRLRRAASLLRNNPELNVSEIADCTGFSSARYFSKCFKALFHVSPLSYRKGLSEDPEADGDDGAAEGKE